MDARARIIISAVAREMIDEMNRAGAALRKLDQEAQRASQRQQLLSRAATATGLALTGFASAGGAALYSATRLAARVETLGVVTKRLGQNIGVTETEVRALEKAVAAKGITLQATRGAIAQMIQADIDLAHATNLARLAQDAAVISNQNSSDTFTQLINVISVGNPVMARTLGLQVSFEEAYAATAKALGVNVDQLTQQQKVQARANEIMRAGVNITGAYEEAMTTAGKQILSLDRHIEESRRIIGELLLPTLASAVSGLTAFLEKFEALTRAQQQGIAAGIATAVALAGIGGAALLAIKGIIALQGAIAVLGIQTVIATGGLSLLAGGLAALVVAGTTYAKKVEVAREETRELARSAARAGKSYEQYRRELDLYSRRTGLATEETVKIIGAQRGHAVVLQEVRGAVKKLTEAEYAELIALQRRLDYYARIRGLTPSVVDATSSLIVAELAAKHALDGTWAAMMNLASESDNFRDKTKALNKELQEVAEKIQVLRDKPWKTRAEREELEELIGKFGDLKNEIRTAEQEHTRATKQILFNILQQQLAVDGLTQQEVAALLATGKAWGLFDQAAVEAMTGAQAAITAFLKSGDRAALDAYLSTLRTGVVVPVRFNIQGGVVGATLPGFTTGGSYAPPLPTSVPVPGAPPAPRRTGGGPEPRQRGGQLPTDRWTLVGDPGPNQELVSPWGYVFDAQTTKKMLKSGLVPGHRMVSGGSLFIDGVGGGGGGSTTTTTAKPGFSKEFLGTTSAAEAFGGGGAATAAATQRIIATTALAAVEAVVAPVVAAVISAVPRAEEVAAAVSSRQIQQMQEQIRGTSELIDRLDRLIQVTEAQGDASDIGRSVRDNIQGSGI